MSRQATPKSERSWRIELCAKCEANHFKKLSKSLENLRQQQNGTDVEIKCRDGSVYAHKFILISSCDYFKAMFTTNMCEEASGMANFTTTSRNVMEIIIEYLYTSQTTHEFTEGDKEFLMDLLNTCHLMQLNDLLQATWKAITKGVNAENFCTLWKIGIKLNLILNESDPLIEFATKFEGIKYMYLRILDETEMKLLVISMVKKGEMYRPAIGILAWNWDGTRNEGAKRLMENCNPKSLSNQQLSTLCLYARRRKRKAEEESIFIDEAFTRLKKAIIF